ncbi:hypothetical protein DPMN_049455 [Dreissena polymorpha]|uniref:Uncharacterized protein n=1 Tax=Dreissena polymorpha TaxID=45954 RepID=A0A9D4CFE4_DREPO|nr:hypothetical protein DPMN_049455 [Dreissena polymorpha]
MSTISQKTAYVYTFQLRSSASHRPPSKQWTPCHCTASREKDGALRARPHTSLLELDVRSSVKASGGFLSALDYSFQFDHSEFNL